jgi:hypothetical protein
VGIGTTAPSSPLTVNGTIQSLTGGFKFPDGSVDSSAALPSVNHDTTLAGSGTSSSPLRVTAPINLILTSQPGGAIYTLLGVNETEGGVGTGGVSTNNYGMGVSGAAYSLGSYGIFGYGIPGTSWAGYFDGDVNVAGNLVKSGGSFKIDDPTDPDNKYLYHSFVESPDMKNIYDGTTTTDAEGNATIQLPGWFQALNQDFRYELTPIGQFAQAIVATEVENNQFTIKTSKPNVKVSWQITDTRHDVWANSHRIPVEVDKPEDERGYYIHPELYGQPADRSIIAAHHHGMFANDGLPVPKQ